MKCDQITKGDVVLTDTGVISRLLTRLTVGVLALSLLAACAPAPSKTGIDDPYERRNRAIHNVNKGLDRAVVRPVATAYGTVTPAPVRDGISNFSSNLAMPGIVINDVLQFNLEDAGANTMRFLLNSTFGLGGLLDFSSAAGINQRGTDFGETLRIWGVGEGRYAELPIFGPSTERHAVGKVVDMVLDPFNYAVPRNPEGAVVTGTNILARLGDRYRFSDTIDSIFYESADSYAQARLLYLQNRRFQLDGEAAEDEYFDPYEDVFGEE